MTTAINKLVNNFPYPSIPPIIGQPLFQTLVQLHLQLNSNAASIHSNLGNGQLGLIQLSISDGVYNTLSAMPFLSPANPGTPHSTGAMITELGRLLSTASVLFHQYTAGRKALEKEIRNPVDAMFLPEHCHGPSHSSLFTGPPHPNE
jgi:hypothetical protein